MSEPEPITPSDEPVAEVRPAQVVDLFGEPVSMEDTRVSLRSRKYATFMTRQELERMGFDAMVELAVIGMEARKAGDIDTAIRCFELVLPFQHARPVALGVVAGSGPGSAAGGLTITWKGEPAE